MNRWSILALKLAALAIVGWFVHQTVQEGWAELQQQKFSLAQLRVDLVILAVGSYGVGMLLPGVFWRGLLGDLGVKPRLLATLRAYSAGHLGKYVPGKAMVLILRAGLIRDAGVLPTVAVATVFVETLTLMAVGAVLAVILLLIWFPGQKLLILVSLAMFFPVALPTIPAVMRLAVKVLRVTKFDPELVARTRELKLARYASGWCLMLVSWLFVGGSAYASLAALGFGGGDFARDYAACTAASCLAVVAGFLSFIPGGFVVREAVFVELFAPTFGEGAAVAGALGIRLLWLLSEVVISGILYVSLPRQRK